MPWSQKQQKPQKSAKMPLYAGVIAVGLVGGIAAPDSVIELAENYARHAAQLASDKATEFGLNPNCRIKGNISINTGERIYHVPGQEFYSATRIRPDYGERWFCTEEEARAAGWRKARR